MADFLMTFSVQGQTWSKVLKSFVCHVMADATVLCGSNYDDDDNHVIIVTKTMMATMLMMMTMMMIDEDDSITLTIVYCH